MRLIGAGAVAAIIGGIAWVIKGGGVLVTGEEPPLFAVGPPLFAVTLIALAHVVGQGRAARIGRVLAYAAAASWAVGVVLTVAGVEAPEESFTAANAAILLGFLSTLGALTLLGTVIGRNAIWPSPWRWFPFGMGASIIPAMFVGAALEAVNDRLLEIPIVLYGVAWMVLGALLWRHPRGETS